MSEYNFDLDPKRFGKARLIILINRMECPLFYEISRTKRKNGIKIDIRLVKDIFLSMGSMKRCLPPEMERPPLISIPSLNIFDISVRLSGNFSFACDLNSDKDEDAFFVIKKIGN